VIKNTIAKVAGNFTTNRMITDYVNQYYLPLAKRHSEMVAGDYSVARELAFWKKRMRAEWPLIEVRSFNRPDSARVNLSIGGEYHAEVELALGSLSHDEIGVELVLATNDPVAGRMVIRKSFDFEYAGTADGVTKYICNMLPETAGIFNVAARMYAKNPSLPHRQDFDLIRWL